MWIAFTLLVLVGVSKTGAGPQLDVDNAIPASQNFGRVYSFIDGPLIPGTRVVGGTAATPGQLPYQVAVYMTKSDGNTYFCGGSLISPRYVLTAAHCTADVIKFQVLLGALKLSDKAESTRQTFVLDAGNVINHPNYSATARSKLYDIALLQLPADVALSASVQTIRLPSRSQAANNVTFEGAAGTVSGWGRTSDAVNTISDALNLAAVPVIGNPLCALYFLSALYGISPTQVCVGSSQGTNACSGDSGGPLTVVEDDGVLTQVGLVSIGFSKCESSYATAFTRLTSYLDFIASNTDVKIRD